MREYKIRTSQDCRSHEHIIIKTNEPIDINRELDIITIGDTEIILEDFMIEKAYEARKEYVELEVK